MASPVTKLLPNSIAWRFVERRLAANGGRPCPPMRPESLFFILLGSRSLFDLAIYWVGVELDVEPLSVGMCPRASDPCPDRLLPVAVGDVVGNVRRGFRRGRGFGLAVRLHRRSPSRKVKRETGKVRHTSISDRLG